MMILVLSLHFWGVLLGVVVAWGSLSACEGWVWEQMEGGRGRRPARRGREKRGDGPGGAVGGGPSRARTCGGCSGTSDWGKCRVGVGLSSSYSGSRSGSSRNSRKRFFHGERPRRGTGTETSSSDPGLRAHSSGGEKWDQPAWSLCDGAEGSLTPDIVPTLSLQQQKENQRRKTLKFLALKGKTMCLFVCVCRIRLAYTLSTFQPSTSLVPFAHSHQNSITGHQSVFALALSTTKTCVCVCVCVCEDREGTHSNWASPERVVIFTVKAFGLDLPSLSSLCLFQLLQPPLSFLNELCFVGAYNLGFLGRCGPRCRPSL